MKASLLSIALLLGSIACGAGEVPEGAKAAEVAVGAKATGFSLVNAANGETVTFKPGDGKTSVVVFTCNHCPYAKAFEQRILTLAADYAKKGVAFYAVNPNDDEKYPDETMEKMKERALEKKYTLPYLKDGDSAIAKAYGAKVTPHVFVVDGKGDVRYRGYVDDSAKPEERKDAGLANALDQLLAGQEVANASTKAFGCTIKWKA